MHRTVRLVGLFAGYGLLGFTGDQVARLMAQESPSSSQVVTRASDVGVVVSSVVSSSSERCAYQVERRVSLDASATERLRIDAGAGELRVEGRDGLSGIRAVGTACASDEEYLDDLQVTLERGGGELRLETHYPDGSQRGWGRRNEYARIDLVVEVPRGMALDVEDSSGGMELSGTGALSIDDSSGEIVVRDANGDVSIDDSSGGIDISDVVGHVDIDDGSGEIDVRNLHGRLDLRDGSGSIRAEQVEGSVVVSDDGSGSISVRDVSGDFQVRSDGSGGIRYSGVKGTVDIPRDKRKSRRRGN